jgi:drug/metabolite transporter (DMT)-like permease
MGNGARMLIYGKEKKGGFHMKKLIVILGVVGISFGAVFGRLFTAPIPVMVFYRSLFVTVALLGPALIKCRKELCSVTRRELLLALGAGAAMCVQILTYFKALDYTSIAAATVLIDVDVLFVALGTVLFLHKKLTKRAWIAIAVAFGGSVVIALADSSAGSNALLGDAIALIGAAGAAAYMMFGALGRQRLSNLVYSLLLNFFLFLISCVLLAVSGTPVTGYTPVDYWSAVGLAVCCTLLGFTVFNWGLKYLPPAFISTSKLLEPLFSSIWGLLLFREKPGILVIVGGVIVVAGVVLYISAAEEPAPEVPAEAEP